MPPHPDEIATRYRTALEAADLTALADLLDPDVRWGPPDVPAPPCRNRDQVLAWYRRGRAAGVRATVSETVVVGDRIVVGLAVSGRQEPDGPRWQVLTVSGGQVTEIVGFDRREDAVARAGGG